MDSDDEREIKALEQEDYRYILDDCDGPELRESSHSEHIYLRELIFTERVPLARALQATFHYRLPRFLTAILGLHAGHLDLSGRSPARYHSIMKRFADLKNDMFSLTHEGDISHEKSPEKLDQLEQSHPEPGSAPTELPLAFQEKWRIDATTYDISRLRAVIDVISSFLDSDPRPVLQKVYLGDMPSEIIHYILKLSGTAEVKRFGSTCRRHWEISRHYVYRSCTLRFRNVDHETLEPSVLHAARNDLVERINGLASQPIIYRGIQSLHLGGLFELQGYDALRIVNGDDAILRPDVFASLDRALLHLLSKTENIRCFSTSGWYMSLKVVDAVLSLKSNPLLDIRACRLPPGPNTQRSSSILNAILSINNTPAIRSWKFVLSCPNLRNLTLHNTSYHSSISTFPPFSSAWTNPFRTVERLIVTNLSSSDISVLHQWLDNAKMEDSQQSLQLTHFKLVADDFGLCEADTFLLLASLCTSPMRCLSLSGLHYTDSDLLAAIAASFPSLESLTLRYLQSSRQINPTSVRLPKPSWEYAEGLSHFTKLKHFGWNWYNNDLEATPSVLEFMEDGWPDDTDERINKLQGVTHFMDGHSSIVKLLAARCRTLETVCLLEGESVEWGYTVRRVATDDDMTLTRVVVKETDMFRDNRDKRWRFFDLQDLYDPGSDSCCRWPLVHPSARPEEEQEA